MNKSYKTIWNAKTNSWVVVSEATKSKGKSSGTILISALVVASALGLSHYAQADFGAGGCSPTGSSNLEIAIGANDALGCNVQTNGQGGVIGIGAGVTAVTPAGDAIAIGTKAIASAADGDMLAIGAGAQAIGIDSTAIGGQTVASGRDSIVIGGNGSSATATGATALGYNSNATGVRATALGSLANATGENAVAISNGSNSASNNGIAIGLGTSTAAGTSNGIAIGALSHSKAENAMALGSSAQATAREATAIGNLSSASQRNALAIGQSANAQALDSIAIGGSSDFGATRATGQYGIAIGTTAVAAQHAISMGYRSGTDTTGVGNIGIGESTAVALKGDRNIAIGEKTGNNFFGSQLIGSDNVAIGTRASAGITDALGAAVAIGKQSAAADNGVAIGSQARANGGDVTATVAIGNSAIADGQGSVAIGATSVANVAGGAVGYAQTTASAENKAAIAATNSTSLGAVSVGTGADGGNRQIVNVAAGTNDSDAVNVAQLKATAETPLSFTADSGAQVDRKLGETLKISAGNATGTATTNLLTTTTADGIVISFKETPTFKGADMSGEKITNVGAGSVDAGSTDAVNGGQINTALGSVANKLGGGTTFDPATGEVTGGFAVGGTTYNSVAEAIAGSTQGLADTPLTFAGNSGSTTRKLGETLNITGGAGAALATSNSNIKTVVTADGVDIQFADAPIFAGQVKANGFDASGEKIVNVGAGTAATDAVNIGQLTTTLGGNVTYNPDGTLNTGFTTNTGTYNSVADAINAVGSTASKGWNLSTNGGAISNVAPGATVDFAAGSSNVVVSNVGNNVKVDIAQDINLNSVKTGNTTMDNNGVAVGSNVRLGDTGLVIAGGPSVTTAGIDAGGKAITNVAAGVVSATSTDAVNGSQLFAVQQVAGRGWDVTTKAVGTGQAVGTSVSTISPGSTATFTAGNNLVVTQNGAEVQFALNSKLTGVESIGIEGGPTINNSGIVMAPGNTLNMGGNTITNVGAGTASSDAVNVGQLNSAIAAVKPKYYSVNSEGGANLNNDGATGSDAIASGKNASATKANAVAVGHGAVANHTNSVALGAGSVTADYVQTQSVNIGGRAYQFAGAGSGLSTLSVGAAGQERQLQNVAAGRVSETSTDAINGSQLYATNQAIDNLQAGIGNVYQSLNYLDRRIDNVARDANAGSASAMAMASMPQAWEPNKTITSIGLATYQGESAYSLGVSRMSDNGRTVINFGATGNTRNRFGVGVGMGYQW